MNYSFLMLLLVFSTFTIFSQTPCNPPNASITSIPNSIAKICKGDLVSFDASLSYAQTGFNIDKYYWDYDNGLGEDSLSGVNASFVFNDEGVYKVKLRVKDDNTDERCLSTNFVEMIVVVAPTPSFNPISSDITVCLGDTVNLVANPDLYLDKIIKNRPYLSLDTAVMIPDESGNIMPDTSVVCLELAIDVQSFLPHQHLFNINNLLSINVNIEHSFLEDLKISIICPSGKSVILRNRNYVQGEVHLGEPIDNLLGAGIGWDYGWSPNSNTGTLESNLTQGSQWEPNFIPSGIYESDFPLDSLIGCPLNGIWILKICDFVLHDDGYVFNWGLNFSDSLYPTGNIYDINIGAEIDSSSWTTNSHTSLSSNGNNLEVVTITGGAEVYLYTVTDSYGCMNDTVVTINVLEPSEVYIDTAICEGSAYVFPDGSINQNVYGPTTQVSAFSNMLGCDSIINTSITLNLLDSTFIDTTICNGSDYIFPDGSLESNITTEVINETVLNRVGKCDSVVTTVVHLVTIDSSVLESGIVLTANANGYSYQWINCEDSSVVLANSNFSYFTAIENGSYAVELSDGECMVTSECFSVVSVGTLENKEYEIKYYPNPIVTNLSIILPVLEQDVSYSLFDTKGQFIKSLEIGNVRTFNIDFSSVEKGAYLILISTGEINLIIEVIK